MTAEDQTWPDPGAETPNRLPSVEYVTVDDIHERWSDVNPGLVRLWVHRGFLDPVRDPDGRTVRMMGRNVYRWHDVVAAEKRARQAGTGRPRGR